MRVLHITPGLPDCSGPAEVALGLCTALAAKGLDVTIFTTNFGREKEVLLECPYDYQGFHVHYFPLSKPRRYFYSPILAQTLKRCITQFDIVHIHGIWLYPTAIAAYYCRKHGIPYLIRPRGNLEPYALHQKVIKKKIYGWLIERRNLNNAAAIHFLNEKEAEGGTQFGLQAPIVIIPNGTDPLDERKLQSLRGRFRLRYPELSGKQIILFLGRINPIKGLDRLCEAFVKVVETVPQSRLVLVGPDNGGFSNQLKHLLKKEGLINYTIFAGTLVGEDKLAALVDSDVFCLPSYQEGHSIALMEAMVCGLPAIVTPEVKFHDLEKYSAGIRTSGSGEDIATGIIALLQNREMRKQMGLQARTLILSKYTWDKVSEEIVKTYEHILQSKTYGRWGFRGTRSTANP